MACVYTLGQLGDTVVDGNLCHDVRAYMGGGYCLSQDQGSSGMLFSNNVCLRTTGSPHNTHYGMNLTYVNNIFWGGYYDSWSDQSTSAAGALRTSPQLSGSCSSSVYPTACPDQFVMERNLIGQWRNSSARLFEGCFDEAAGTDGSLRFRFRSNLYWSDLESADLETAAVFGGKSQRYQGQQLTWTRWQELHNGTQDVGSVLGARHPFARDDWAESLNVTLSTNSDAHKIGFVAIDTSHVGPRLGTAGSNN